MLFAILQKYEFSSKSQPVFPFCFIFLCCLRYCKSTSFQANHNGKRPYCLRGCVVCDTAKVRVFKQITTVFKLLAQVFLLFAILQKYEFSSKSQRDNHYHLEITVVCDTAKVRVFKQITTHPTKLLIVRALFAILQKYEFSSKSQRISKD